MKSMMKRTTCREIKHSFGRFFAILAIIALGVGFFSGLRITKEDMVATVENFYREKNFFDLHLVSIQGFDEEDIDSFSQEEQVKYAEGIRSFDAVFDGIGESEEVLKVMSVPVSVNGIELVEGRLPENNNECVIDSRISDVAVGDVLALSDTNADNTLAGFKEKEFTIVGKVDSSYYINFERGTTSLGNGKVKGFIYVEDNTFNCDYYTDAFVCFDEDYEIYSDEYEDFIEEKEELWNELLAEPGCYVLGRDTNIGYACFESDSDIVAAIAKVFPVFFILVAALVCMTTMNRMVEEQRTQIGVLKALGFSELSIMGKFAFYSGSAALAGCVLGYIAGTYAFPEVIWTAYHMMYINIDLIHVFNPALAIIALVVSMLCSIGTTWLSCRYELAETAANLMRPKTPKAGKRVILEYIPFIWKRLKFLHKVSVRNILRYKKRFFMMIIGIGGCTALLLTGFGLKDSISGFAAKQYDEIQIADGDLGLREPGNSQTSNSLTDILAEEASEYAYVSETTWDLIGTKSTKTINMVIMEKPEEIKAYMNFQTEKGEEISYPGTGEAVINNALAESFDISVGDEITVRNSDMEEIQVTVSGIFKNHVYNYIFISPETYEESLGLEPLYNAMYINFAKGVDSHKAGAKIMGDSNVTTLTINEDTKERLAKMMGSLDYVVLLVIICAAALAFIVLYNLTNINITERMREIATLKVLGFFRGETSEYVFRENRVLTTIGIAVGLGLGVLLHRFVIEQIHVDMISFDVYISPLSYLYSILLTFVFNFCVNRVMAVKLECINMAESLKSVD